MKTKTLLFGGIITILAIAVVGVLTKKPPVKIINEKKTVSVGADICNEFPKDWVASVTGKTIIKTEKLDSSGLHVCQYYTDDNNFITLRLNNLSVEDQKKSQITLGRTVTTNQEINMDNFVARQENGLINNTVLVLNPNLFLSVDRSSTKAASDDEITAFAQKVADRIVKGENQVVNNTSVEKKEAIVPLPQETDIVRSFFEIIGENRAPDAVNMMTPANTSDDTTKQAWNTQFSAFKSLKITKVEPSLQSDWTENNHNYKVTLQVEMKPEAASALPMPNYGWDNGQNIRWIQLQKIDGKWLIGAIATGP